MKRTAAMALILTLLMMGPASAADDSSPASAKPSLGVTFSKVTTIDLNHPYRKGLMVVEITSGSPAERAGIHVGDILTEFGNTPLKVPRDMVDASAKLMAGTSVAVKLIRGANLMALTVQF